MFILLAFVVMAILFSQSGVESKAAEATGIAGDANADGKVDVRDLVRGLQHKNDLSIDISGDVDLNKNTVLSDEKDCQYLKVILLDGKYKVTALQDAVKVGKYDNEARTFEVSLPKTVELSGDTELDSATVEGRDIGINQFANGKMTLSSTNLADREYKTLTTVLATGMEKVEVITMPIDVYAMVINDETELNYFPKVAQICPTGYYILGNDIYCTGTYTSNYNVEFRGTFNGLLHTIYNMNVVSGANFQGGLFGMRFGGTGVNTATLQYISFVNATYSGKGGFIASVLGGKIYGVYIDIAMTNCGTGTYANSSAVLGTNTYGGLKFDEVIINYRVPLSAGATTGTTVYEMHQAYSSYDGVYVVGADTVGVQINGTVPANGIHNCGAYPTEGAMLQALTDGTVNTSSWNTGFWKIKEGNNPIVPIPIHLAPCVDSALEAGVLADFTETAYKNNVGKGRAVGTSPTKVEVLSSYEDAAGNSAKGVLKITPTPNANGKFDFSVQLGKKIQSADVESISIRIAQKNVKDPGNALRTFFVTSNRSDTPIWDSSIYYDIFAVPENTWTTITLKKSVIESAADDDGYLSKLSFFCDSGRVDTTIPASIYIDEIYYTLKDETTDVKIGVISDIHFIDGNNGARENNFRKALQYYRENDADVIIMNGDISDLGTEASYGELLRVIKEVYPDESTRPTFISTADNHEYYDSWSWTNHNTATYEQTRTRFLEKYAKQLGQTTMNTHETIGGYHFIGVSADTAEGKNSDGVINYGFAGYSEQTIQWLKEQLEVANAEDSSKPIFVAIHQPLKTGYGLTEILEKYPQAVVFTSHSHYSIKQESSINQKDYTAVNTGSLFYISNEKAYVNTGNVADYLLHAYNFGEGLLVSVVNNQVSIERRDFFWGGKIKTDWVFDTTNGKDGFVYTDARKDNRVAPTFVADAKLAIAKYTTDYQWSSLIKATPDDSVILTFPSATHDDFVQYYTVVVKDSSGNAVTLKRLGSGSVATSPNYVSDFYWGIDKMATTQELVVKGLTLGETYTFEVCAVETFGKTSEPLTGTFVFE